MEIVRCKMRMVTLKKRHRRGCNAWWGMLYAYDAIVSGYPGADARKMAVVSAVLNEIGHVLVIGAQPCRDGTPHDGRKPTVQAEPRSPTLVEISAKTRIVTSNSYMNVPHQRCKGTLPKVQLFTSRSPQLPTATQSPIVKSGDGGSYAG